MSRGFRFPAPSERVVELTSAIILSLAALGTSWSGYQSTLWNGNQARQTIVAGAMRSCATRALNSAGQARTIDVVTFSSWVAAKSGGDARLATFYEARVRPEFAPAFAAWRATRPGKNANAPTLPFVMPQYRLAADVEAARCDREAVDAAVASQRANEMSDNYMLSTVVFALVLFFAGIVHDARSRDIRLLLLGLSVAACIAGIARLTQLPLG